MSRPGRGLDPIRRLHTVLGAPGLIIGLLSLTSFVFGLVMILREYDRPRRVSQDALTRVVGHWLRAKNYLGYTLIDYADQWRSAPPNERTSMAVLINIAVKELGEDLNHYGTQFPLLRVISLDLRQNSGPSIAHWRAAPEPGDAFDDGLTIPVTDLDGDATTADGLVLHVGYRIVREVEAAVESVETSYHRLLMAILGLSGYSLLSLAYMAIHARTLRDRAVREAASEATLDLADRTCHELGNVAFVVANERRNLANHIELLERFVEEERDAIAVAARRAGLDPAVASRLEHALRREYGDRGIDPDLEVRGSVEMARSVCRQIATCSDYIALTIRELDGYLKQTSLPVELASVDLAHCLRDAITLLAPRLDALGVRLDLPPADSEAIHVRADRRLLMHALVNLIKNAVEAASGSAPVPVVEVRIAAHGHHGRIVIRDNGPGIPEALKPHLFEPGISTKGAARGKGLAIVRESVEAQHGSIRFTSSPDDGTAFEVDLPLSGHDPAHS